ncbi:MAG: hypothetical protein KDE19_22265 [Caldilineaceae bacterium]|nr:hypothetical protein [Caldilineaceae bacterium]
MQRLRASRSQPLQPRPIWLTVLPLLFVLLIAGSHPVEAEAGSGQCTGYPSPHLRMGVNVAKEGGVSIDDYDVTELYAGWYHDYNQQMAPAHPVGMLYHQMLRTHIDTSRLDALIGDLVDANPGAVWVLGNEPDRPGQDGMIPEDYAAFYHDTYTFLKARDPTSRVAIGAIVQATPLRLRYLDMVLAAYEEQYGVPLPTDMWTLHGFNLPENCGWGADIPPGMEEFRAEGVPCFTRYSEHGNLETFKARIRAFRGWMLDNGYRDYPLNLSEYGILLPPPHGFTYPVVSKYMLASFDFLLNTTDSASGYPADSNRLVQQFAWFSLNYYAYGEPISGLNGNLYNHDSRQIQPLGQDFAAYAEKRVLSTIDLQVTALDAVPQANPGLPMTLQGTFINRGGIAATNVAMRFWDGNPTDGGQLLGTAPAKPQVLPDCYHQYTSEFTWSPTASGSYTIYADLTADNLARDQELSNNQQQLTVLVNEGIAVTATPQPTPVPTATATPLPDQTDITVGPTTGGTLRRTDQNGNRVTVQILGDSVTESTTFRLQTSEEETDSASQAARQFASQEFTVVAERAGTIIEDFVLQNPAILTIEYDDKDVVYSSHVGVTEQNATTVEDDMTLYVYNSATRTWQSDGITLLDRDVDANQLRVITEALGRFGLYGSTPTDVNILFLPVLMK